MMFENINEIEFSNICLTDSIELIPQIGSSDKKGRQYEPTIISLKTFPLSSEFIEIRIYLENPSQSYVNLIYTLEKTKAEKNNQLNIPSNESIKIKIEDQNNVSDENHLIKVNEYDYNSNSINVQSEINQNKEDYKRPENENLIDNYQENAVVNNSHSNDELLIQVKLDNFNENNINENKNLEIRENGQNQIHSNAIESNQEDYTSNDIHPDSSLEKPEENKYLTDAEIIIDNEKNSETDKNDDEVCLELDNKKKNINDGGFINVNSNSQNFSDANNDNKESSPHTNNLLKEESTTNIQNRYDQDIIINKTQNYNDYSSETYTNENVKSYEIKKNANNENYIEIEQNHFIEKTPTNSNENLDDFINNDEKSKMIAGSEDYGEFSSIKKEIPLDINSDSQLGDNPTKNRLKSLINFFEKQKLNEIDKLKIMKKNSSIDILRNGNFDLENIDIFNKEKTKDSIISIVHQIEKKLSQTNRGLGFHKQNSLEK